MANSRFGDMERELINFQVGLRRSAEVWTNPHSGVVEAIPRHSEIKEPSSSNRLGQREVPVGTKP